MGLNGEFYPMTIKSGMAIGSAVGQNIAVTLNASMNPSNNIPPSLPKTMYYYAKDNNPLGPFDKE